MIVTGGIVRNRAWILDRHLEAVRAQTTGPGRLYYLTGDNIDETEDLLAERSVDYSVLDTGFPGYERTGEPRYHSSNMGPLRNEWAKTAIRRYDPSYLWVVDSDVLPSPDSLQYLLSAKKPIVGAWVPGCTPMMGWDDSGAAVRTGRESLHSGVFEATMLGGCYLLRRDFLEAAMPNIWGEHPQGEDGYLADRARELGFDIVCQPAAVCEHVMEG